MNQWLGFVIFVVGYVFLFAFLFFHSYDDTDDAVNHIRSGLVLYTDYKTGVQYVSGSFGLGITPRLDRNGKPMIKEEYRK